MSSFEFFFSFYGLLLALSVAVVAAGAVKALKLRARGTLGKLTPLLAVFILLDIATFWQWAWRSMRGWPFSYGLLVVGMVIALIYFLAASFVFPEDNEDWATLDDHYDARKRVVLVAAMVSNTVMFGSVMLMTPPDLASPPFLLSAFFWLLYVVTLTICCVVRNHRVNAAMLTINIVAYLIVGALSLWGSFAALAAQVPAG